MTTQRPWVVLSLLFCTTTVAAAPLGRPMKAPLHVTGEARAVHVHAEGIEVGEVAVRIGAAAGLAVRVRHADAQHPVWVHADGTEPVELLHRLATSVGLVAVERKMGGVSTWWLAPPLELSAPVAARVTRVFTVSVPDEVALLVGNHFLSPVGRVVPFPARSAVVVEDTQENVDAIEKVIAMLTPNTGAASLLAGPVPGRVSSWGVPAPCRPANPARPWRALDAPPTVARGEPAGQAIVVVAALQGRNVVVGCGGDRPAWASVDKTSTLEELAEGWDLQLTPRVVSTATATASAAAPWSSWAAGVAPSAQLQTVMDRQQYAAVQGVLAAGDRRPRVLLFPVRKPESYSPLGTLTGGVVTTAPTMGWLAVEASDGQAADKLLRTLAPRLTPEMPAMRTLSLEVPAPRTP